MRVEPEGIDLKEWWRDPRALKVLQGEYVKYLASFTITHIVPLDHNDGGSKPRRAS